MPRAGWLAVGAIVAALTLRAVPIAIVVLVIVVTTGVAIVGLRRGRPSLGVGLLGLAAIAGRIALGSLLATSAAPPTLPEAGCRDTWRGLVTDVGTPAGDGQRAFVRLLAAPACLAPGAEGPLVFARLPRHPPLVPGDRIGLDGAFEPITAGASGFADYLHRRGAAGSMRARTLRVDGRAADAGALVEGLRWGADEVIGHVLPAPEAGLAAGILIGLRERVDREVSDDFLVTGLTHVVAISGWNIALVAGIATGLLRAGGLRRRWRSIIVLTAIVAYTVLAGAEASVVRAAVMGGVVIVAREGGHPSGAAAALGLATGGLLLAEPAMIDDIGFQLSVAATAGLLALGTTATARVAGRLPARTPAWLAEALGISLAAQLATMPLILLHFGRLSIVSPLANVLVAPVVPFAMLGAAVALLVGPILASLPLHVPLAPVLVAAWLPLAAMVRGADLLATVPFASVALGAPADLLGALIALAALVAVLRRVGHARRVQPDRRTDGPTRPQVRGPEHDRGASAATAATAGRRPTRRPRGRLVAAATAVLVGLTGTVLLLAPPRGALHVTLFDVGQGDAILLEGRHGTRILVDGGPDPDVLVRRLDERIPVWDRHVELAIVTHPHEDHAGGIAGLLARYRLDGVAETGLPSDGAGISRLRDRSAARGLGPLRLLQGDRLDLDGARIDVLWPPAHLIGSGPPPTSGRIINDTSIVLLVRTGRHRLLLTGDLEEDRDADLLAALPAEVDRIDVLKVAHHGSATASSEPFLRAVRPRIALVSAGADNTYGHPSPATLGRLAAVGATTHRTDRDGTVSLTFDGVSRTRTALLGPAPVDRPACRPAPVAVARSAGDVRCYPRPDGRPHESRGALPPPLGRAIASAAAARDGRGRGRRLPRAARRSRRCDRRPAGGRDRRAPPRHRQGPPARASP